MSLWIVMAVIAAATTVALLAPLFRGGAGPAVSASAIYRDQLLELERDRVRGLIGDDEAAAARAEIARRLIQADHVDAGEVSAKEKPHRLAAAVIIGMPLAALALYLTLGAPGLPDQPLASRAGPYAGQDIGQLVAAVEARLKANPNDGRGWEVLAPVYGRLGRFADAAGAYRNALRLLGSTAEREGDLGEALVRAADGKVPQEAREAFARATRLAPEDPRPKFYLALALTEDGRKEDAIAAWRQLLAGAPADASWSAVARDELAKLEGRTPSEDDANKAPPQISSDDVNAMIEGMVGNLAARLEGAPDDPDGWAKLIRSYMVLGREVDARAALDKARAALTGTPEKFAIVEKEARDLGLIGEPTP